MHEIWYAIAVFMLTAYVVLDGFDFGAGALHLFVARNDRERRQVLAAIGPFWDGNEVWLLAAGGALFVGFPRVLASGVSGFYFAIFLVLWCLILRGIAIEFRSHVADPIWRATWDFFFWLPSTLLPVFFGAALGNLLRGLPLDADGWFALALFTDFSAREPVGILDWYTVLVGLFALVALPPTAPSFSPGRRTAPCRRGAARRAGASTPSWPRCGRWSRSRPTSWTRASSPRSPGARWRGCWRAWPSRVCVACSQGSRAAASSRAFLGVLRFPGGSLDGDRRLCLPDHAAGDRGRGPLSHRLQRGGRSAGPPHRAFLVRRRLSARDPLLRRRVPPSPREGAARGRGRRLLGAAAPAARLFLPQRRHRVHRRRPARGHPGREKPGADQQPRRGRIGGRVGGSDAVEKAGGHAR